MAYHCPACSRKLLSRRNKLSGFCQTPLPVELCGPGDDLQNLQKCERGVL